MDPNHFFFRQEQKLSVFVIGACQGREALCIILYTKSRHRTYNRLVLPELAVKVCSHDWLPITDLCIEGVVLSDAGPDSSRI